MEHNNDRDLGRLEGKVDMLQRFMQENVITMGAVCTKLENLHREHSTLKSLLEERAMRSNKWRDPAVGALSGGAMALVLGWLAGMMGWLKH